MKGIFFIAILISCSTFAQPILNQWNSFGRDLSYTGGLIYTDSCYYTIGCAYNDTILNHTDAVFTKFGYDGSILDQGFFHVDSLNMSIRDVFIQSPENDFVTIAWADKYFYFIKFNHKGDTIQTQLINDFYLNDSLISIGQLTVLLNESDSSYSCLAQAYHENTNIGKTIYYHLSSEGELIDYSIYETPYSAQGHSNLYAGGMCKTSDGGYLIATSSFKNEVPVENTRYILHLIKLDANGVFQWQQSNWDNNYVAYLRGIVPTSDGGYIIYGLKGVYAEWLDIDWVNYACKLKSDYTIDWEIEYGYREGDPGYTVGNQNITPTADGSYVVCGREWDSTNLSIKGVILKFSEAGDLKWDSYFEYISYEGNQIPEHDFLDIEQTSDEGFVLAGYAIDFDTIVAGYPGQFAWLVKTDSNGCLVPGCQDFLNLAVYPETVQIHAYPNPTANFLNIYYYNQNFTGKAEAQVYDLQGKLIQSWKFHTNDMTYIYDVTRLDAGIYVFKVVKEGSVLSTKKILKE